MSEPTAERRPKYMSRRICETARPTAAAERAARRVVEWASCVEGFPDGRDITIDQAIEWASYLIDEETGLPGLIADCEAALEWLDEHDDDPEIQTPAQRTLRAAIAKARR